MLYESNYEFLSGKKSVLLSLEVSSCTPHSTFLSCFSYCVRFLWLISPVLGNQQRTEEMKKNTHTECVEVIKIHYHSTDAKAAFVL